VQKVLFIGSREQITKLREYARQLGVEEDGAPVTIAEAFPGYAEHKVGMAIRGARFREGLTQRELSESTGIPQRHISELENGKRQMGKDWAKRLAKALNVGDFRVFIG
jgi:ribosome-binding protein aMBF1 (putative translation factor)